MFTARLVTFVLGLLISNIHVALLYCDTDVKQVITKENIVLRSEDMNNTLCNTVMSSR